MCAGVHVKNRGQPHFLLYPWRQGVYLASKAPFFLSQLDRGPHACITEVQIHCTISPVYYSLAVSHRVLKPQQLFCQ